MNLLLKASIAHYSFFFTVKIQKTNFHYFVVSLTSISEIDGLVNRISRFEIFIMQFSPFTDFSND